MDGFERVERLEVIVMKIFGVSTVVALAINLLVMSSNAPAQVPPSSAEAATFLRLAKRVTELVDHPWMRRPVMPAIGIKMRRRIFVRMVNSCLLFRSNLPKKCRNNIEFMD